MTTLDDPRLVLAKGRRLIRISRWVFGAFFAVLVAGTTAMIVDLRRDRPAEHDHDPALALIFLSVVAAGMIAFRALHSVGRHLVKRSVEHVVANPEGGPPETLRLGLSSPFRYPVAALALLGLGFTALAFISSPAAWIVPALLAAYFVARLLWLGPAVFTISAARFDASGIELPQMGVQIPWTSVAGVEIKEFGVHIGLSGPVSPTGRIAGFWTRHAIQRLQRNQGVDLSTDRQDAVIWIIQRYR